MKNCDVHNVLQFSLKLIPDVQDKLSPAEWLELFDFAVKQSMLGIFYSGVERLPADLRPPMELVFRWSFETERIRGLGKKMSEISSELTRLFAEQGRRSVILKGCANGVLYPDPELRQSSDVDIWIDGSREETLELIKKLGLQDGMTVGEHDAQLAPKHFLVPVEIHFKACSGNRNPFSNRRLQKFLEGELVHVPSCETTLKEGRFNVPSKKFAMAMQLSHIQRHFLTLGIGLRQLVDYFFLLKSSTKVERSEFGNHLADLGLKHTAGALMWALHEMLGLEPEYFVCPPDERRGRALLDEAFASGDFERHFDRRGRSVFVWWLRNKVRLLKMLSFDFVEVAWQLFFMVVGFVFYIPKRLKMADDMEKM